MIEFVFNYYVLSYLIFIYCLFSYIKFWFFILSKIISNFFIKYLVLSFVAWCSNLGFYWFCSKIIIFSLGISGSLSLDSIIFYSSLEISDLINYISKSLAFLKFVNSLSLCLINSIISSNVSLEPLSSLYLRKVVSIWYINLLTYSLATFNISSIIYFSNSKSKMHYCNVSIEKS